MKALRLACLGATTLTAIPAVRAATEEKINVISVHDLIGREVHTMDGKAAGEVEFLLIRSTDGSIRYAIIEGENEFDDQMIAVPWEALQTTASGRKFQMRVPATKLVNAPRVTEDGLRDLLRPTMIARVREYWMAAPSQETPAVPRNGMQQLPEERTMRQPGPAQQPAEDRNVPDLLITETRVRLLMPPNLNTSELTSVDVVSSDGKTIGAIEDVAIDVDRGRVAYTLVGFGGYMGLGEKYLPVPFAALQFTSEDRAKVNLPASKLRRMRSFEDDDIPTSVTTQDMTRLYRDFGAKPYWREEMARR